MIKFSPLSPNDRQSPAQSTITTISAYQVSLIVRCLGKHAGESGASFNELVVTVCSDQGIEHVVFCSSFRSAKNLCFA